MSRQVKAFLRVVTLLLSFCLLFASCQQPNNQPIDTTGDQTTTGTDASDGNLNETTGGSLDALPEVPKIEIVLPTKESQGFDYEANEDGKTCTITGIGSCTDTEILFPEYIGDYLVTDIADEAFYECDTIQKIYLSKQIANVGIVAFASCPKLELIFVSDQVQSIGEAAFADCKELQYIYVDENNVNYQSTDGNLYSKDGRALIQYAIGKEASDYSIPNGVCKFGSYCFYGAQNLKKVRIASSVSEPGEYLFASCTNLETVIIENGVTEIGKGMFEDCEKLSEISIPETVVRIEEDAFWGCESLTNVSLPKGLKEIGHSAFYSSGIESIELPQGLEKLGGWVFAYTSVKSVTIPDSVTEVGSFGLASYLESIIVSENHPLYKTIDGNLYSKDGKKLIQYAPAKQETSFKIPDEVTTLCTGAFYYGRYLTSVTISANVEIIEQMCFSAWATQLKTVVFENETGWKYYDENNEPVEDISVSDPEQNAENLKKQGLSGKSYTWKRAG